MINLNFKTYRSLFAIVCLVLCVRFGRSLDSKEFSCEMTNHTGNLTVSFSKMVFKEKAVNVTDLSSNKACEKNAISVSSSSGYEKLRITFSRNDTTKEYSLKEIAFSNHDMSSSAVDFSLGLKRGNTLTEQQYYSCEKLSLTMKDKNELVFEDFQARWENGTNKKDVMVKIECEHYEKSIIPYIVGGVIAALAITAIVIYFIFSKR